MELGLKVSNWEDEAGELPLTESHLRLRSEILSWSRKGGEAEGGRSRDDKEEGNSWYIQNN